MSDIPDVLNSVTFTADPIDTLFLNEQRVGEQFTLHLGAIKSFVRSYSSGKRGGTDIRIFRGELSAEQSSQVTWSLEAPIAQALVLRAALTERNVIQDPAQARKGEYVVISGVGYLTGGDYELGTMRVLLDPIEEGLYDQIESERSSQEQRTKGKKLESELSSLTLLRDEAPRVCVTFLNERWLSDVSEHWELRTEVFGVVRKRIGSALRVSCIHAYERWGAHQ